FAQRLLKGEEMRGLIVDDHPVEIKDDGAERHGRTMQVKGSKVKGKSVETHPS
ncbi:MAG: hypothetical protein HY581_06540, partial [Nitrospirae bacterium]|nr:hypothetical protein [Nitrospirota bacterium]